jgi:hypothetical protein
MTEPKPRLVYPRSMHNHRVRMRSGAQTAQSRHRACRLGTRLLKVSF